MRQRILVRSHRFAGIAATAILLSILLIGCASSQKLFERARQYEAKGDYLEASREYIDVLERESDWTEARTRLALVGPLAVDTLLAHARREEVASRFPEAVRALDKVDGLREAASGVGVTLQVPADYAEYRRSMVDEAIAFYVEKAARAEASREWSASLEAYDRALRYDMVPARRADVDLKRAHVHFRWAESEMDRRRYRSAFAHAEEAFDLGSRDAALVERLSALQDEALHYGTRRAALLPLRATSEWESEAPLRLLSELDASVIFEHWTSPPLFIDTIDPGEVRRQVRNQGFARREVDRKDAASIGRALEADFVLFGEMRRYRESEEVRKEETKRIRLRGSRRDTTYVLRTAQVKLEARGHFFVVDPFTEYVLAEFDVSAEDEGEFRRGSYNGDVADLDLSSREQAYFGADMRADAIHDAQDRLLEKLSDQIAQRAFDAVLTRIL